MTTKIMKIKCTSVDCNNTMFSPNKTYSGISRNFNGYCIIVKDDAGNKKTISLTFKKFFIGNKFKNGELLPQYAYFQLAK